MKLLVAHSALIKCENEFRYYTDVQFHKQAEYIRCLRRLLITHLPKLLKYFQCNDFNLMFFFSGLSMLDVELYNR